MTKLDAGLITSLPASDPGSAAVWGSKRINPRPQFCLCLAWSGCPSNDDDDVHLFGAVSSPGCANFGLKRAANDVSSVKEAIDLLQNSRDLCARAGLKLHKVLLNKLEVLECLPESDRATSKSFNIRTDSLPLERALGVVWCIQNDT